jgi:hypothetical protein
MPGPPPEHPHLRLLKGNPGKRPVHKPPEPARSDACPSVSDRLRETSATHQWASPMSALDLDKTVH